MVAPKFGNKNVDMVALSVSSTPQEKYRGFIQTKQITLSSGPMVASSDRVFTIGSCFAREIRFALAALGIDVTPHYRELKFDRLVARVDNLPEEEHLNYYNAFTIRQEFEKAAKLWRPEDDGSHVLPETVTSIMQAFVAAHVQPGAQVQQREEASKGSKESVFGRSIALRDSFRDGLRRLKSFRRLRAP